VKIFLITPQDPTQTCIDEAKLVAGSIDGDNARNIKAPFEV
jgi:hypothetical protein